MSEWNTLPFEELKAVDIGAKPPKNGVLHYFITCLYLGYSVYKKSKCQDFVKKSNQDRSFSNFNVTYNLHNWKEKQVCTPFIEHSVQAPFDFITVL